MSCNRVIVNPSESEWGGLCARPAQGDAEAEKAVREIIEDVRTRGDAALRELSAKFDGVAPDSLEVTPEEFAEAEASVSASVRKAIAQAMENISAFHKAQVPSPVEVETVPGVHCSQKPVAIENVGLYIPGGTAPLFSTVLMLAVPAKIAGCSNIVLCTPVSRTSSRIAPEVLYAAKRCGVDRVFKIGGAQAVAAMAFGTGSIPRVDKIFGPGNRFVTIAKQMLGGSVVSIDMPAGPSEVMVLADESAKVPYIAADMLSQAEHGADSQAMLVCTSRDIAEATAIEIERQMQVLDRRELVEKALSKSHSIVFDGPDAREKMCAFADMYAPEHLIVATGNPGDIASRVRTAGSIFIGNYSPESAGDYASGTNHTLPTSGWGHSCSGVNIDSFIRKITYQELTREGLESLSETIITMAEAEGLQAHANAVKVRIEK